MKKLVILAILVLLPVVFLGGALVVKKSSLPEVVTQGMYDYHQEKTISGYLDNIRVEEGKYVANFEVGSGIFKISLPVYLAEADIGRISFGLVRDKVAPGEIQELWGGERIDELPYQASEPVRVHVNVYDSDKEFEDFLTYRGNCIDSGDICEQYERLFVKQNDFGAWIKAVENKNWLQYLYVSKVRKTVVPAWRLSQLTKEKIEGGYY